jgi:hypothetical protein
MTVADLITALGDCDPQAIVLIPAASAVGQASEPVIDVTRVEADHFDGGPAAQRGAVRLTGFPFLLMVSSSGAADLRD